MPAAPAAAPAPSAPARLPLGRVDLAILALVGGLLVVWSPNLYLGLLTPRMALALVALGPGLVVVAGLARRGDVGARWLAALVAWSLLSALVAPHPRLALIGSYGSDIGWIWGTAYAAAWGLGRRLAPDGVRLLPRVLAAGVGANAAFAFYAAITEPTGDLAAFEGRVVGLQANSLFLASLLAGGMAMLGWRAGAPGRRGAAALAGLALFTGAVNLTGSRAALAGGTVLALVAAASTARRRGRRAVAVAVGGALLALALGFAASVPLQSDSSGASRISAVSSSSGFESRTLAWGFGLDATAERPVVGWGPGRFREAIGPRTTAAFVRAEGPDKIFYDAHNLLVEQLTTTGVVGLVLLGGFVVAAARRARGPAAWFAAGVALTWLTNPTSASTAPVALIALGAAWSPRRAPAPHPAVRVGVVPLGRAVGGVLAAVGLVAGAQLVVVDALVDQGTLTGDVATVERAQRWYPGDATITGLVTDARTRQLVIEGGGEAVERGVLESARRATREDPTRSLWWVRRASAELAFGPGTRAERLDAAEAAYDEALAQSPWSVAAMLGRYDLGGLRGDADEIERWRARLCEVDQCPERPPLGQADD